MPASKRDVVAAVEALGGTVSGGTYGRTGSYDLEAPDGYVWNDGGSLSLVVEWSPDDPPGWRRTAPEAWTDALSRVECGIRKMTAEERRLAGLDVRRIET